jgi:hypothetical protein
MLSARPNRAEPGSRSNVHTSFWTIRSTVFAASASFRTTLVPRVFIKVGENTGFELVRMIYVSLRSV